MAVEDQRAAVAFSVTLSSQLVSASMATLAVEGAYVWYALGARETLGGFEILAAGAAIAIALSIFAAGKGITAARDAGFSGSWSTTAGKTRFNLQAVALLAALVLLTAMFLRSGPTKQSTLERKVDYLLQENLTLRTQLADQLSLQRAVKDGVEAQIKQLQADITRLKARAASPAKVKRGSP